MTTKQTLQIASLPDREYVVAELWYGDVQWGELSQKQGSLLTLKHQVEILFQRFKQAQDCL